LAEIPVPPPDKYQKLTHKILWVEEVIGAEAAEVTVKEVKGEEQAGEVGIAIEEVEVEVIIKVPIMPNRMT